MGDIFGLDDPVVKNGTFKQWEEPPVGATCTHPRMRCPNGENGCGKACGHWWCPDCGLSWDEGAGK